MDSLRQGKQQFPVLASPTPLLLTDIEIPTQNPLRSFPPCGNDRNAVRWRSALDEMLCKPAPQETHIDQLRILSRMTGDKWFERQADRLQRDEVTWKAKYRGNGVNGRR